MAVSRNYSDQEVIDMFDQSIARDNSSAKTYFELASFYDNRSENSRERSYVTLKNLGRALLNSRHFDHLAFPRFITIWLNSSQAALPIDKKATELVTKFVERCSEAQAVNYLSQLVSRIGHSNLADFIVLERLLIKILLKFPDASLWKLVSVANSSNLARKSRVDAILSKIKVRISHFT
jgi:hypothetical protein